MSLEHMLFLASVIEATPKYVPTQIYMYDYNKQLN